MLDKQFIVSTALDYLCGCVSGWVQVLVMQPFQLVKVRLINQSLHNPEYHGIIHAFKKIKTDEGSAAFYKGSLAPFYGVGAQVAVMFGSNQLVKKMLMETFYDEDDAEGLIPTIEHVFLAGLLTGIPSSLAVTPIDHTRIICQAQRDTYKNHYNGSIDAGKQLFKKHGIRGLYLGFYPTLLRQCTAMPIYFGIYQLGMRWAASGDNIDKAPILASFFIGGISGMASWAFTYPIDYIKTVVQSDNIDSRKYKSAIQCVKVKFAEQGIHTFFKGLGVTVLRSFPVNGIGFLTFQWMMRITGRKRDYQIQEQQQY